MIAAPIKMMGMAVERMPTLMPEMMVVAEPVEVDATISLTGALSFAQ